MSKLKTKKECEGLNKNKDVRISGTKFQCRNGCIAEVLCYFDSSNIDILISGGIKSFVSSTTSKRLRVGAIFNPYHPRLNGIGYFGVGKYQSQDSFKKITPAYRKWNGMFDRVRRRGGMNGAYRDVTIDDRFYCFQDFAQWYEELLVKMNLSECNEFELDKDFLSPYDKIYSPDTCVLLPLEINTAIVATANNTDLPIGVSRVTDRRRFVAEVSHDNKRVRKSFCFKGNEELALKQAAKFYKDTKVAIMNELYQKWSNNQDGILLDQRVLDVLKNPTEFLFDRDPILRSLLT